MTTWVGIVLLSVVASAFSNIVADRFRPIESSSSLALASGTLLGAAAVLAPFMFAAGQFYELPIAPTVRDWALLLTIAITAANLCLFFEIVRRAGAVFFSQFNYIVVPSGILWGMLLFHERHSPWIWLAVLAMLSGIALVNTGNAARAQADISHPG